MINVRRLAFVVGIAGAVALPLLSGALVPAAARYWGSAQYLDSTFLRDYIPACVARADHPNMPACFDETRSLPGTLNRLMTAYGGPLGELGGAATWAALGFVLGALGTLLAPRLGRWLTNNPI